MEAASCVLLDTYFHVDACFKRNWQYELKITTIFVQLVTVPYFLANNSPNIAKKTTFFIYLNVIYSRKTGSSIAS